MNNISIQTKAKCQECNKVFNFLDEEQANEFYYGHECEGN